MTLDYLPTASVQNLKQRAALLRQIRDFFDQQGFWEVQLPCLSADTVVDCYLNPIAIASESLALPTLNLPPKLYLQTSPEFLMKRLLAAGADAIYQLGPAFRSGERGPHHNREFTMLEWYRIGDTVADAVDFVDSISQQVLMTPPSRRMTYQEAFLAAVQLDPLSASDDTLQNLADRWNCAAIGSPKDRDGWLNAIFALAVQPVISNQVSCIVTDYPASQAALAQLNAADPRTAQRFEWFVNGVELGNGYGELLDPEVLVSRAEANNRQRQQTGWDRLPIRSRLETAMRNQLPPCAGVAVGFDRLMMVGYGLDDIAEVMAFPIERS